MELGNSSHVAVLGRSVGVAGAGAGRCGAEVRVLVLVHTHPDNTGTRAATRVCHVPSVLQTADTSSGAPGPTPASPGHVEDR